MTNKVSTAAIDTTDSAKEKEQVLSTGRRWLLVQT
jgi:hypothetical protein